MSHDPKVRSAGNESHFLSQLLLVLSCLLLMSSHNVSVCFRFPRISLPPLRSTALLRHRLMLFPIGTGISNALKVALPFAFEIRIHSVLFHFCPPTRLTTLSSVTNVYRMSKDPLISSTTKWRIFVTKVRRIYNFALEVNARSFSAEIPRAHLNLCACEKDSQYTCVSRKRGIQIMETKNEKVTV